MGYLYLFRLYALRSYAVLLVFLTDSSLTFIHLCVYANQAAHVNLVLIIENDDDDDDNDDCTLCYFLCIYVV